MLDVHADRNTFNRFDKFNTNYMYVCFFWEGAVEHIDCSRAVFSRAARVYRRDQSTINFISNFEFDIFTDKAQLHKAADIIQKLKLIAQNLPPRKCQYFVFHAVNSLASIEDHAPKV